MLNVRADRKHDAYWDTELEKDWDSDARSWPTKHAFIAERTVPEQAILDVGCGTGHLLRDLKGRGYRMLHGLDHSAYAVKRLRSEGIQMTCCRLPHIALPDESFDVVIASQVLEHIIRRNKFVAEIWRVLKSDGRFFCFVPDDCLDPLAEPSHVAVYTREKLRSFLSNIFTITELGTMVDVNHPMSVLYAVCEKR